MKEEIIQLRAFNQDCAYRCERLGRILEEKTHLIKKYQQGSNSIRQKIEAARVAEKQIEDLQTVVIQAVAHVQQEVEEMQKGTETSDENAVSLQKLIARKECNVPSWFSTVSDIV